MFLVSLYRVIKFAGQNFFRNIWLAVVTTTIISISLLVVTILFSLNVVIDQAVNSLHKQVDVSVYFQPDIESSIIQNFQNELKNIDGVSEIIYISRDQALDEFRAKYEDNQVILDSLDELGDNPLGDTLIIQARSIDDYDVILQILESDELKPYIQEKNFQDYNTIIKKISDISSSINRIGLSLSFVFIIIAILVTFNTIRIAIYTYREELGIMRLVGASKSFIEWPFFVEATFYAVLAVIVNILIVYPILNAIQPFLSSFFGDGTLNMIGYFNTNFIKIFGTEFLGTLVLVTLSSWLAVRKYIKV